MTGIGIRFRAGSVLVACSEPDPAIYFVLVEVCRQSPLLGCLEGLQDGFDLVRGLGRRVGCFGLRDGRAVLSLFRKSILL